MKMLLVLTSLCLASSVHAITCDDDLDVVETAIGQAKSCDEAVEAANNCAFGASGDYALAGAASQVCLKEAGTLSKADKKLLLSLEKRCDKAYAEKEGTMYISINSFCKLNAVKFINDVVTGETL